eukprot:7721527-Heterocapsa_arctica.AAC.1
MELYISLTKEKGMRKEEGMKQHTIVVSSSPSSSRHSSTPPREYEDPSWDMLMIVHVNEIGHGFCVPTELEECSSGQGWWRLCKDQDCYRCMVIKKAVQKHGIPTEKGETISFLRNAYELDMNWDSNTCLEQVG